MKIEIEDYGMNAEGVGKIDGKVVLVANALVGEIVDCSIEKDFGNYAAAKINEIVKPSNNRVDEKCVHCKVCGGCNLMHMNYDEQLKFKQTLVKKTIKKIAKIDINVSETVGSKRFNYRNKMSFSVGGGNCGLKGRSSDDIFNIDTCSLTSETINIILNLFKQSGFAYNENVKNLVVRELSNQVLVGVVVKRELDLTKFLNALKQINREIGLFQVVNQRKDSVVLDGKVIHVGGIKKIKVENFGLTYYIDLMGFHQTNIEIQNKIYERVLSFISDNESVVNGFSGQGLLSAVLATKAKHVTGIEINKYSHQSAEELKKSNSIHNLTNICGDFHKHIIHINKANTIILDPTKKGCGSQVMHEIKRFDNIIYISCNPIALAKDLRELLDTYDIESVTPFDMFPNTLSVETVVKLRRKGE